MTTLKFRAWHRVNKAFVYSNPKEMWKNGWYCSEGSHDKHNKHLIKKDSMGFYADKDWLDEEARKAFNSSAKWDLFTGREDNNNKEIYSGDIVTCDLSSTKKNLIREVIFVNQAFCLKDNFYSGDNKIDKEPYPMLNYHNFQVISNIYQNKDR